MSVFYKSYSKGSNTRLRFARHYLFFGNFYWELQEDQPIHQLQEKPLKLKNIESDLIADKFAGIKKTNLAFSLYCSKLFMRDENMNVHIFSYSKGNTQDEFMREMLSILI
jgi:hypothetical protein